MVHHGRAQGRAVHRGVVLILALALGAVALMTAPPSTYESAGQLLHRLASLTKAQVHAMITHDRSTVLEVLNSQPEEAAREWPPIPQQQRLQLERRREKPSPASDQLLCSTPRGELWHCRPPLRAQRSPPRAA